MDFSNLEGVFVVLVNAAVMSIVFTAAVTPLFNWRLYKKWLGSKGWKMPILTILAFFVFWGYDLDIIYALLIAMGAEGDAIAKSIGGQVLTALLISGGSQGFHSIIKQIKFLNRTVKESPPPITISPVATKPDPTTP